LLTVACVKTLHRTLHAAQQQTLQSGAAANQSTQILPAEADSLVL
jgi:hypothetical protein